MDKSLLKNIITSALLVSETPLDIRALNMLFIDEQPCPTNVDIQTVIDELIDDCDNKSYQLVEVSNGYRFQIRKEMSPWLAKLNKEPHKKYSRAFLETLAIIAYRQPVTRGEVEEIRGVSVSSHMIKSLLELKWIRVVGQRDVPGKPELFATTADFLNHFSLQKLEQLPPLEALKDLDSFAPLLDFGDDSEQQLVISPSDETAVNPESAILDAIALPKTNPQQTKPNLGNTDPTISDTSTLDSESPDEITHP